jgi:predicted AlkP superfamily pyrophosphatase or phosphodiesterase
VQSALADRRTGGYDPGPRLLSSAPGVTGPGVTTILTDLGACPRTHDVSGVTVRTVRTMSAA